MYFCDVICVRNKQTKKDYFNYQLSSNTVFTLKMLACPPFLGAEYGIKSDIISDELWVIGFKAGLVFLLIIEFAIPIFFYIHVPTGVWLNYIFHVFVGMAAYDFSSVGMATLPFLLSLETAPYAFMTTSIAAKIFWLGTAISITMYVPPKQVSVGKGPSGGITSANGSFEKSKTHGLWLLWSIFLGIGLAQHGMESAAPTCQSSLVAGVGGILVGFMLITGCAPYLGIKTQSTFSMFSNLRVGTLRCPCIEQQKSVAL